MKKEKIIFWTATIVIALFEGVMPALTSQTELAKEGIRHLGYPEYFGNALVMANLKNVPRYNLSCDIISQRKQYPIRQNSP